MPAVDMNRHSQEINLANFTINKIVKCAFHELIDPSLGFDSDTNIWEMTTSVAELAFLCLQTDRDMRPTMVEVLHTLKEIQTSEVDHEKRAESNLYGDEAKIVTAPPFPATEDKLLLKQVKSLPSPNSVKGSSNSTCPKSFSCGNVTDLSFPFSLSTQPDCGIVPMSGCDAKPFPSIQLLPGGDWYYALGKEYSYTANDRNDSTCPKSFACGNLTDLSFPFSLSPQSDCGLMTMSGCDAKPFPRIRLLPEGDWYYALEKHNSSVCLGDPKLNTTLRQHKCQAFNKIFSLPSSPSISFNMINLNKFFKCNSTRNNTLHIIQKKNDHFAGYNMYNGCEGFSIYYKLSQDDDEHIGAVPTNCSLIRLPIHSSDGDLFNLLGPEILVEWKLSDDCNKCHYDGGQCQTDKTNKFYCQKVFGGVGSVMITCLVVYCIWRYKKRKFSSSHLLSTKKLSDTFNHDVEEGSIYFGVPVFSYSELEETTNDFNSSRELGDGGYGTVYYRKLKDGREVAVKRLHEHNCKRMQQFVNEIEILTRLRHNNLVTLYGCTSRRSRELLLVYDYGKK
ncbi:hypothetical protein K7X08_006753 [Anisodus acutangulus]|uniref:Protein kinase domain-containing protein n=1 Tax=Anisodus acutangulus TaxID=402998 RepID=A0A9Q1RRR2_9SOLA|nr:hypothetical protein K7X08_006753 [Anisodus acutangulus]